MSALTAVFRILQADSGVVTYVGHRRYPVELPQNADLPALVLTLVDERDGRHLLGSNRYPVARFLVDCVADQTPDGYWDADVVGEAVKAALIDYRGKVEGYQVDDIGHDDIDFTDKGEGGQHWRRRLGFLMRYREIEPEDDEDSPPGA